MAFPVVRPVLAASDIFLHGSPFLRNHLQSIRKIGRWTVEVTGRRRAGLGGACRSSRPNEGVSAATSKRGKYPPTLYF